MKYPVIAVTALSLLQWNSCLAWDGFDADTADLVEIIPETIPSPGDQVEVRSYDTDTSQPCHVESVRRNRRTIEVVVRDGNGAHKTLVMEGR